MTWFSVRTKPNPDEREHLTRVLFDTGSQGVHEDGDSIVAWFDSPVNAREVSAALTKIGYDRAVEFRSADATDWSESWKDKIVAHEVGTLRVSPPWLAETGSDQRNGRIALIIDPGMAFGTGDHGSTRCALRLLQSVVRKGDRVADLGSGSAILSIAAALIGAGNVIGIENDPDAMGNAHENIARNGVEDEITLLEADAATILPLIAPFEVIVANIISSVLLQLLPVIHGALTAGGSAILSGILTDERMDFVAELELRGWDVIQEESEEGWCALAIRAR